MFFNLIHTIKDKYFYNKCSRVIFFTIATKKVIKVDLIVCFNLYCRTNMS